MPIFAIVSADSKDEQSYSDKIYISLVYPQKSNAPKRESKKIEKPLLVKNEVSISVTDIKPEQLKHPELYVEYFLDGDLIFSTQEDKKEDKSKKRSLGSLGFILDTTSYPDGTHTLVANLWDKDGPSAIGIREIIIQNPK